MRYRLTWGIELAYGEVTGQSSARAGRLLGIIGAAEKDVRRWAAFEILDSIGETACVC